MHFRDPEQLGEWLAKSAVDTSLWGIGSAKTVENLWQEIIAGDSVLQSEPILRKVRVVSLRITQNNQQLLETSQTFRDGRKRYPSRPPSEKMKPNETPVAAVFRCLQEELGCTEDNVLVAPELLKTETIHRDSPSYPTLQSEFTFHTLKLTVHGLPATDFTTTNQAENDPVLSIGWSWRALE